MAELGKEKGVAREVDDRMKLALLTAFATGGAFGGIDDGHHDPGRFPALRAWLEENMTVRFLDIAVEVLDVLAAEGKKPGQINRYGRLACAALAACYC
jgi:hypothetical protein